MTDLLDGNPRAVIGGNKPPVYDSDRFAELAGIVKQRADDVGAWLDLREITTEEQAEKLNDQIAGLRALAKEIEDQRKKDKEPHLEAGREVDRVFKDLSRPMDLALDKLKTLLTAWARKKAAEKETERQRKEAEASRIEEEARKDAEAAAARNDVIGEAEADARQAEVDRLRKGAAETTRINVASYTGGGRTAALRSYFSAGIKSRRQAFITLESLGYAPQLDEALVRLGNDALRKGHRDLPGFTVTEDQRIA